MEEGQYKIEIIPGESLNSTDWDSFVLSSPEGTLYCIYEYASAVAPGWQCLRVYDTGEELIAAMPLLQKKKFGITYSLQPLMTQTWGILFKEIKTKNTYELYSYKRKILIEIVQCLKGKSHIFEYNFSPEFEYPLPFYWDNYLIKVKYTYQIRPEYKIPVKYSPATIRQLSKAKKADLILKISNSVESISELYTNYPTNVRINIDVLTKLININSNALNIKIYEVENREGKVLAAGIFGYYNSLVVYLGGAFEKREKGMEFAMTFLMDHVINEAMEKNYIFDFEGSMIEPVERFFRGFGAVPVPYLQISKGLFSKQFKKLSWLK